jgi:hypothetical protein
MMAAPSMMSANQPEDSLPALPPDHGFVVGERVEAPVYGKGKVKGTIRFIDVTLGKRRYHGHVILGDDGIYYELHPEITRKIA